MKFEKFIKDFINWSESAHKPTTTDAYSTALKKFGEYLKNDPLLKDIGVRHAESFIYSFRKSTLSISTIDNYRGHLNAAFNKAIEWKLIEDSPFKGIKKLSSQEELKPEYLEHDEMMKFLKGVKDLDLQLLIASYYVTGLSRGELLDIKWEDIDIENRKCRIPATEHRKEKKFIFKIAFLQILNVLHDKRGNDELVFPHWIAGTVSHKVNDAFSEVGYQNIKLKNLRLSYRSMNQLNGGNFPITEFNSKLKKYSINYAPGTHLGEDSPPEIVTSPSEDELHQIEAPSNTVQKQAWIFQGNPRYYDLEGALQSLEKLTWEVNQHKDKVGTGDTVYLWQSGPNAGILAVADILSDPSTISMLKSEKYFVRKPERFNDKATRVFLSIKKVLKNPIPKGVLSEHQMLSKLGILKAPQGSNFFITDEQAHALMALVNRGQLNPEYPLTQCAEEVGFDEETLKRWVRAIERKKQAILYGPPGTGKTFIAEKLSKHIIGGGDGFSEVVQFHPAYSYEDFIQGIRPISQTDGSLHYPTVPGRFLEFCKLAKGCDDRCVLIIDEINRANLSRVFGELMYLLEYRDREVPLANGGKLRIPVNVRLIGTMNTADRSIALVDHALRRRFAFLPLYPNYDVLKSFLSGTNFPVDNLIEVLNRLNNEINDPHYEIGITFFLSENIANHIEDIWKMEIEPYLEEYFFDQLERVDEYRWINIEEKIIR